MPRMHHELADIWRDIDADPDVAVAIIRGAGKAFSAGGDLEMVEAMANDFATLTRVWREARDLVYNVVNCSKPIVSAMHGPAVGAGLVCGLLADISIAAKTRADHRRPHPARRRGGRPCRDHLAAAVRHGEGEVLPAAVRAGHGRGGRADRPGLARGRGGRAFDKALEIAERLAAGSPTAIRWTKHALNNWLRMAGPTFDASLALEFLGFAGPDVREGIASLREKRAPRFGPEAEI